MEVLLFVLIVVLLLALRVKEHFTLKVGGPGWITTDDEAQGGTEIVSLTPNTCPPGKELQAGMCYDRCRAGYKGLVTVCWKETENIGIGVPVQLEPCPSGWTNDGLTCREPLKCEPIKCATGLDFFKKGCSGGKCSGGRVKGRLDNGGICPKSHPDKIDGLCYKKCPKEGGNPAFKEHLPGMPYLCGPPGPLSYDRGVGKAPAILRFGGKYPFLSV